MAVSREYLYPRSGQGPFSRDDTSDHPNIIFISVDMVPPEFWNGAKEHVPILTPNMDALREDGLFFKNAFCTSPLCTPSRASYLTGRYSYITSNSERGHDGHAFHLRENDWIFPQYLKALGYRCGHVGKCHVGAHRFIEVFGENDAPWDRWSPPWFDDSEYIGYLRERGFQRFSFSRSIYGLNTTLSGKGNFYGGWIAPQQDKPFPIEASYTAFLVEKALQILESRDPEESPLYLQLDFFGPHQPFAIPAGMEEREREIRSRIGLPALYEKLMNATSRDSWPKAPWPEPRVYRLYRKNWGLFDGEVLRDYRVANMLQFELIDRCLGKLLNYLKEKHLYENTWIFFIADHGEMNGELGLIDKGSFLNPRVTRVPLAVKPPQSLGLREKGITTPASLLDLVPTIFEITGVQVPDRLDGMNLMALLETDKRPADKPVFFEVWNHVVPNPSIGTVFNASDGKLYSYVYNTTDDIDELYRLGGGDECLNLIESGEAASSLQESIEAMAKRLGADPRWFGYFQYFTLEHAEHLPDLKGDRQLFRST